MHRACSHTVPAIHSAYCHFSGGGFAPTIALFFFLLSPPNLSRERQSASALNPQSQLARAPAIHRTCSQQCLLFTAPLRAMGLTEYAT